MEFRPRTAIPPSMEADAAKRTRKGKTVQMKQIRIRGGTPTREGPQILERTCKNPKKYFEAHQYRSTAGVTISYQKKERLGVELETKR